MTDNRAKYRVHIGGQEYSDDEKGVPRYAGVIMVEQPDPPHGNLYFYDNPAFQATILGKNPTGLSFSPIVTIGSITFFQVTSYRHEGHRDLEAICTRLEALVNDPVDRILSLPTSDCSEWHK